MRRIVYAGTIFYTGDALAQALLEYARALARHDIADTVFVPGRTTQGDVDKIEVLIGPASQMVSEPVDFFGAELEDSELVARLADLTAQLEPRKPEAERRTAASGRDGSGDVSGFDDLF